MLMTEERVTLLTLDAAIWETVIAVFFFPIEDKSGLIKRFNVHQNNYKYQYLISTQTWPCQIDNQNILFTTTLTLTALRLLLLLIMKTQYTLNC